MKKIILSVAVFASTFAMAQTGKVGVNTITPVRTLDVEGNLRVKTLGDGTAAPYSNILVQNPATGLVDALPISGIKDGSGNEPWFVQTTNVPATGNTQNIYQMGNVAVGRNLNNTGARLHVQGAAKLGSNWGSQLLLTDAGGTNAVMGLNIETLYVNYLGLDRATSTFYITGSNGNATRNRLSDAAFVIEGADFFGTGGGYIGIHVTNPTEKLHVNGRVRVNELPLDGSMSSVWSADGTTQENFKAVNAVVANANGILGSKPLADLKKKLIDITTSATSPLDLTAVASTDIKNLYVIDGGVGLATVTLPPANNTYHGVEIEFYIWGGGANVQFKGNINIAGSSPVFPVGWGYSGSGSSVILSISGATNRFAKISAICIYGSWFFDHGLNR